MILGRGVSFEDLKGHPINASLQRLAPDPDAVRKRHQQDMTSLFNGISMDF